MYTKYPCISKIDQMCFFFSSIDFGLPVFLDFVPPS